MIGGIGWFFGGPYAGLVCFFVGGMLIVMGLTTSARPRWRRAMWEAVEKIHRALGIESTWAFVLIIAFGAALVFGLVGGAIAWIVDVDYKHSPEYKADHPDPKSKTVPPAVSNSASQSATVQSASSAVQGTPRTSAPPSKVGAGKESKQVAKKEDEKISKEEEKRPGFELLHAGGTVGDVSATHNTVRGQPSPGTSMSMIFVPPGGKAGKITISDFDVNFNPVRAIPPPPDSASISPQLSYKTRVGNLRRNINDWLVQKEQQQPEDYPSGASDEELHEAAVRTKEFWKNATADYIRQFGPEITLLVSQLQKCESFNVQIKDIWSRLGFTSQSPGPVSFTVRDLGIIENLLPSDDSQLPCAEGKRQ
jgi:hypothetical protein